MHNNIIGPFLWGSEDMGMGLGGDEANADHQPEVVSLGDLDIRIVQPAHN
jgi:hypothetical protein